MKITVDDTLVKVFSPNRIISAYYDYKLAKWDRFSGFDKPEINVPMGADGVDFSAFEKQIERHATNISYRVKSGKYIFYPFRVVEKLKEPATPSKPAKFRPLSIVSIRDALVQSILYQDVLYEPIEKIFSELDDISLVSYAYRKGKSAPLAAERIFSCLQDGYWFVYDADITKYFDSIPHDKLLTRLAKLIGGKRSKTFQLVKRFVNTDVVPYDTYKYARTKGEIVREKIFHWQKPKRQKRSKGIPQGGVLSGMLANLYLHDFDVWVVSSLGRKIDLQYIRYADDFVILVKSAKDLKTIEKRVENKIKKIGLEINQQKTDKYDVRNKGLDFVGFHFNKRHIRAKDKNIERFKKKLMEVFQSPPQYVVNAKKPKIALKWLIKRVNRKILGQSGATVCPVCRQTRVGASHSWITFFNTVTDLSQIRDLDKWMRLEIYNFMYKHHRIRLDRKDLRDRGLKSLVNQKYKVGNMKMHPCLCDIERDGIWRYMKDMFQGKKIKTIAKQTTFLISKVDKENLTLFINKNKYVISKDVLLKAWEDLKTTGALSRASLEHSGVQCSSQVVAILRYFPAIQVKTQPIQLYFSPAKSADFLIKK